MNCNNVQSTNFGMAYRIGNKQDFIKYLNQLSLSATPDINAQMKKAIELLGTDKEKSITKFVDVTSNFLDGRLTHNVFYRTPCLDNEGKVIYRESGGKHFEKLDQALQEALQQEKNMVALDAYRQEQAKLLGQL